MRAARDLQRGPPGDCLRARATAASGRLLERHSLAALTGGPAIASGGLERQAQPGPRTGAVAPVLQRERSLVQLGDLPAQG